MEDPTEKHFGDVGILVKYNDNNNNNNKEQVIQSDTTPPKTWKRFVDGSFAIINKNAFTSFHDTLNSIDPHIKFTIEHEKDEQIAFLDMLMSI